MNQSLHDSRAEDSLKVLENDELHPGGHKVWKTVTTHEFPDGIEIFLNEHRDTWSDAANFESLKKAKRGEGDRERSKAVGARRAKTQVRRRCKSIQADCMMTLTYRENVEDETKVQADFKAFRKRLAALGKFLYVATLERQKRGALHMHTHFTDEHLAGYVENVSKVGWISEGAVATK